MPAMPPRRRKALSQGREMLHREVRDRAAQLRAWAARTEERRADVGFWQATAREAEAPSHLRHAGAPIPQYVPGGLAQQGSHGRAPSPTSGIAARYGLIPHGIRIEPYRGS